jgi:hypothetical protein
MDDDERRLRIEIVSRMLSSMLGNWEGRQWPIDVQIREHVTLAMLYADEVLRQCPTAGEKR